MLPFTVDHVSCCVPARQLLALDAEYMNRRKQQAILHAAAKSILANESK